MADRSNCDCPTAASLLLAFVIVLAGCSGTLLEVSAAPATIPADAHETRGYVHGNTTEVPITYPVGAAGLSRDVTARTWVSGYSKTTAENRTAALVLYSSPNVEVGGASVNPLSQLSNRELVGFVLERTRGLRVLAGVDGMSDLREVDARNVTALGEPTRMVSYAGLAEVEGVAVEVMVNIAVVEHGQDVIVALGIHEAGLDERANHAVLIERIEHEG